MPNKLLPPHVLFFLIYNLIYFVPIFVVFLWGYGGGGSEAISVMGTATMLKISAAYIAGTTAFLLGSALGPFLRWSVRGVSKQNWNPIWFQVSIVEVVFAAAAAIVFIISKIALIPTGAYQEYAFDAGLMTSGVWNFSTFCSETLILVAILFLFQRKRYNVLGFFLVTALNCANLLHGTRVFFISSVMSFVAYLYLRGHITVRRMFLFGPPAFVGLLGLTYAIYLARSAASFSGSLSLIQLVSPLMWESMFSQLSLINVLNHPSLWDATGHVFRLLGDAVLFVTPRILLPNKDAFIYINQFSYLSPKGAFNGYATGLIYLGLFFPVFYFCLGVIGSWLYRASQRSSWWFILYVFYTADFLLHMMRDEYLIPMKMFINTIQWIVILITCRWFCRMIGSENPGPAADLVV
ncbi:MAG TPA: hypothetical protein VFA99_04870 [Acidobacteriaceae bacterium]|nr:hypothetical protein [Acidobacteriaceae bacterium]